MSDIKKLVEIRRVIKDKKPTFRRTDYATRVKRRKEGWRTPRGRHNKMRQLFDGILPGPAYGSPKAVRGAHATGAFEVIVNNTKELSAVDKSKVVRIAGSVGNRKKLEIMRESKKLGLHVLNPKVFVKQKKKAAEKSASEKALGETKEEGVEQKGKTK